jgi:uncharacterized protein (DUF433 family)
MDISEYGNKQRRKPMPTYRNWIDTDPNVLFGKPLIKGTRIAVEHILDELAGGTSIDELLEAYPRLTREAIYATLAYAKMRSPR